jgi:hypothetical protein
MRLLVLFVAFLCAGCGILTEADEDQKVAMATAQVIKGVTTCNASYAAGHSKLAVVRTECINNALNQTRALYPYPDLLDRWLSDRRTIAEKFAAGQLPALKANVEFGDQRRKMIEEEQRRLPDGKSETKARHGTLFDSVFKTPVNCGTRDPSVNCL